MLKIVKRSLRDVYKKPAREKIYTKERKCPERNTLRTDIKEVDFFRYFKDKYQIAEIDQITYIKIISEYNKLIAEDILNGKWIKLYPNLGTIMIMEKPKRKFKETKDGSIVPIKNKNNVDWGLTRKLGLINKETGKLIPQYLEKQNEYCMTKWINYSYVINMSYTKFTTSKTFRRQIPVKLKVDETISIIYRENFSEYEKLKVRSQKLGLK